MSVVAIRPKINTPRNTSMRPRIPSCDRSSPEKIGAGVTSMNSNWISRLVDSENAELIRGKERRMAVLMTVLLSCFFLGCVAGLRGHRHLGHSNVQAPGISGSVKSSRQVLAVGCFHSE